MSSNGRFCINGDVFAAETVGDGAKFGAKKLVASVIGTVTVKKRRKNYLSELINLKFLDTLEWNFGINNKFF